MFFYYPSDISEHVYIEVEECPYEEYDIHRCVEMSKKEYELSLTGRFFGDKRKTGQVFSEKKVPIKMDTNWSDYF